MSLLEKSGITRKSIYFKINLVLIVISIISVFAIDFISYSSGSKAIQKVTFDHLTSLREAQKRTIQDYFSHIRHQIQTFSEDYMIQEALKEFTQAYNELDDVAETFSYGELQYMEESVKNYYNNEFLPRLNPNLEKARSVENYHVSDPVINILQYHYIVDNPNATGKKHLLDNTRDGSIYSQVHAKYHPVIKNYLQKFNYYDIFLIDEASGNIVYSVFKEVDFATSLISGPYRNTNFAKAFDIANQAEGRDFVIMVDFDFYHPSYAAPASFIASPIFDGEERLGVLIFQIPIDEINGILTGDEQWQNYGMGKTGESYLIGEDYSMRSTTRRLLENPSAYFATLKALDYHENTIAAIKQLNTPILLQHVRSDAARNALTGHSGQKVVQGPGGEPVLSSYAPLNITDVNWAILSEIDNKEIMEPINKLGWLVFFTSLLIIALSLLGGVKYSRVLSGRIIRVYDALKTMAKGEVIEKVNPMHPDEIGLTINELNNLNQRLNDASQFALAIGKGNFDSDFSPYGITDKLGTSLYQTRESLLESRKEEEKRMAEDKKRNWTTAGIAKFSEILRQNHGNINELAYQVASNIVDYINAVQAAVYILSREDDQKEFLEFAAAFAHNRRKYQNKRIEIGEGLTGSVVQEGKYRYLKEIPENYFEISSGLGSMKPYSLLVMPLKSDDAIVGVLEIALLRELETYEIDFIQGISETIASTVVVVKINAQTNQLLKESKERELQMAQQEEEVRQNMEEMAATQEELQRVKKEEEERHQEMLQSMKGNQKMLIRVLDEVPEKVFLKDKSGKIILANQAVADVYSKKVEEVIGTTDFDNHDFKDAQEYRAKEEYIMENGAETFLQTESITGELRYLKTIKKPFYIDSLKETGLLGIQMDVTETKELENSEKRINELEKLVTKLQKKK